MSANIGTKYKLLCFKFPAMAGPRMREIYEFLHKSCNVQYNPNRGNTPLKLKTVNFLRTL